MTVIHRSPRSITLHTDDSARGVCLGPAGDRADDGVVLRPPGTRPRVGDVPAATPTTKDTIDMIQRRPINLLVQPRCHRIMIMWQRGNEHLSRSVTGESSLLRTVQINQGNNIQQQVAWILFVCSRDVEQFGEQTLPRVWTREGKAPFGNRSLRFLNSQ